MTTKPHRSTLRLALIAALALALCVVGGTAFAQDPQSELDEKEAKLEVAKEQQGVLTTEIDRFSEQIDQLAGEVAVLRNREAIVQAELVETQRRLDAEIEHLAELRDRLGRSLNVLKNRLVEIYKAGQPDALTVILDADGF